MRPLESVGASDPPFSGKVLQLYVDGQPSLVVGSEREGHAEILEQILKREGIPFTNQWIRRGIEWGPAPKGERYELVGAGYARFSPGRVLLDGSSVGYGLQPNLQHAEELSPLLPDMAVRLMNFVPLPTPTPPPVPRNCPIPDENSIVDEDIPF